MSVYNVCTFNVASDADYALLHGQERSASMVSTSLQHLSAELDFCCFQECNQKQLEDAQLPNFVGHIAGTAIAWSSRFTLIKDSIVTSQVYTVCDLLDLQDHKIVRIAAAHIPGFDLDCLKDTPDSSAANDVLFEIKQQGGQLDQVNRFLDQMLSQEQRKPDRYIIGADMNTSPAVFDQFHTLFTESGLLYTPNETPTNFNPRSSSFKKREIDYIFSNAKQALPQPCPLLLNDPTNPSDHIPVIQKLDFTPSAIDRIGGFFSKLVTPKPNLLAEPLPSSNQNNMFAQVSSYVEL